MRRIAGTLAAAAWSLTSALAQSPPVPNSKPPSPPLIGPAPPDVLKGATAKPWLDPPAQLPPLTPPAAPKTALPAVIPSPQKFATGSLRLKRERGQWQLWAGNLLLKDFGPSESAAHEALQVFRDLRINAHGSIGGVFDYWLTEGRAPSAMTRHRQVIPFEPTGLRVERMSGSWVLRDARVILYNFGAAQADAEQALAVCKHYGFNQLGYVGHPVPAMKYLMLDPTPRNTPAGPDAVVPVSARMQAVEAAHPRLTLPSIGDVGERVPVDAARLDLRREGGEWVLYAGRSPLGRFGMSERAGRLALQTLQQFRVTELCRVGDSGFAFFLSNGRAPQGTVIGTAAKPLRTELLNVRQIESTWAICEGNFPVMRFGDKADDAQRALAAIRAYRFDHYVQIDPTRSLFLFAKTRY
jgi:hypothetical protein